MHRHFGFAGESSGLRIKRRTVGWARGLTVRTHPIPSDALCLTDIFGNPEPGSFGIQFFLYSFHQDGRKHSIQVATKLGLTWLGLARMRRGRWVFGIASVRTSINTYLRINSLETKTVNEKRRRTLLWWVNRRAVAR